MSCAAVVSPAGADVVPFDAWVADKAERIELAAQRKGWVLDALNRYRLGFDRGVREALDFELLGS